MSTNHTINILAKAMEYAANFIDGNMRRGVFVRAFVEGEDWAERELMAHLDKDAEPTCGGYVAEEGS